MSEVVFKQSSIRVAWLTLQGIETTKELSAKVASGIAYHLKPDSCDYTLTHVATGKTLLTDIPSAKIRKLALLAISLDMGNNPTQESYNTR